MTSSATAVALIGINEPQGGVPPERLSPIIKSRSRGGRCSGWRPETFGISNFVVAREELVLAATGCASARAPQPLFAKNLRGGRWRVLRWLPSPAPPILAAEGSLIAVGVQRSLAAMDVLVLDIRGGSTRAHFAMPDGYLAFAAPNRLVVSVPTSRTFPITTDLKGAGPLPFVEGPYHLALYSVRGHRLASLGTTDEQHPLISAMHLVTVNYDSQTRTDKLSVRALPGGPTSDIIGFNGPGRRLIASALRWPLLALIETTSAALPNGQFNCGYGPYGPPSAPTLVTFDFAHRAPFRAPPPRHQARTQQTPATRPPPRGPKKAAKTGPGGWRGGRGRTGGRARVRARRAASRISNTSVAQSPTSRVTSRTAPATIPTMLPTCVAPDSITTWIVSLRVSSRSRLSLISGSGCCD